MLILHKEYRIQVHIKYNLFVREVQHILLLSNHRNDLVLLMIGVFLFHMECMQQLLLLKKYLLNIYCIQMNLEKMKNIL